VIGEIRVFWNGGFCPDCGLIYAEGTPPHPHWRTLTRDEVQTLLDGYPRPPAIAFDETLEGAQVSLNGETICEMEADGELGQALHIEPGEAALLDTAPHVAHTALGLYDRVAAAEGDLARLSVVVQAQRGMRDQNANLTLAVRCYLNALDADRRASGPQAADAVARAETSLREVFGV
jgi:hypothetical protein